MDHVNMIVAACQHACHQHACWPHIASQHARGCNIRLLACNIKNVLKILNMLAKCVGLHACKSMLVCSSMAAKALSSCAWVSPPYICFIRDL